MSNSKKYASIYGAKRSIRPDQYLVELIIKRRSEKQGVNLPDRFWSFKNNKYEYWKNIFAAECTHAQKLFNKYDAECIIDAFNSYDCRLVLSVTNNKLEKITKEFQRRKDTLEKVREHVNLTIVPTNILPKTPTGKLSKLSKLK